MSLNDLISPHTELVFVFLVLKDASVVIYAAENFDSHAPTIATKANKPTEKKIEISVIFSEGFCSSFQTLFLKQT